jgi:hypothetical protein
VQVLHEAQQMFKDGRSRKRDIPLSEKMLPGEDARTAAIRGIREELGSLVTSDMQIHAQARSDVEVKESVSASYPGLLCEVRQPHALTWCAVGLVSNSALTTAVHELCYMDTGAPQAVNPMSMTGETQSLSK